MKNNMKRYFAFLVVLCLAVGATAYAMASATATEPAQDMSPAIYVAQKNSNSVVGVTTSTEVWNPQTRQISTSAVVSGSGVVIREGGYIITNNHVVEDGSGYQLLMPDGSKVDAELIGRDAATDIAVLKIVDEAEAAKLVPVTIGAVSSLTVGSTAVAIGNPGGDALANTVTQGIVSGLERTSVSASGGATRTISYIQHDAAINGGNSGGGLFNYKGELIGINNLKYGSSGYSSITFEGLGFAIPVDTAIATADDLIEYGYVQRPALGVTVMNYVDGPDEPLKDYAPAGVYVWGFTENSPAQEAGLQLYDNIYSVNGTRVITFKELAAELDKNAIGDTIEVVVVRYANVGAPSGRDSSADGYYYYFGGGASASDASTPPVSGNFEYVTLKVTLTMLKDV